jgi:hypothetical protein
MSGIPTTFKDGLPAYTVVGGNGRRSPGGVSVVLTGPGNLENPEALYRELEDAGFEQVLSIEEKRLSSSVDRLAADYSFARFVLLNKPLTIGSQINLAAAELESGYLFVLSKDCGFNPPSAARAVAGEARNLCTVPYMFDRQGEALGVQPVLVFSGGGLRTKQVVPSSASWGFFPFEGIGVYNRELFIRLGGYDNSIKDAYWQFMDFGFRAYAWGEKIGATDAVRLTRGAALVEPPVVIGESYRRFYLKNISPVYRTDAAYLPLRRFPPFLLRSGVPLPDAWREFSAAREWVNKNAYRWKCGPRAVIENWKKDAS